MNTPSQHTRPAHSRTGRIRLRPTRYGAMFAALLLAMLIGSSNYNNNLGFLLVFLLGGVLLVSSTTTYKNISGIRVKSWKATAVFAGDQAVFDLDIQSPDAEKKSVTFKLGRGSALSDLPPTGLIRIRLSLPTAGRGILIPGPLTLSTVFPLGLVRAEILLDIDARCPVYPTPFWGEAQGAMPSAAPPEETNRRHSGTEDFQGLRTYQPGDPIRQIAWKTLSRGKGLYIKEFTEPDAEAIELNWRTVPGRNIEQKLSTICGMILRLHPTRRDYGLQLPGTMLLPARGEAHKHRCLAALAAFDSQPMPARSARKPSQ
jgi:uncharacterized protein (DUF58 family)